MIVLDMFSPIESWMTKEIEQLENHIDFYIIPFLSNILCQFSGLHVIYLFLTSMYLSVYLFINQSINLSIRLSMLLSMYLSMFLSMYLSTNLSIKIIRFPFISQFSQCRNDEVSCCPSYPQTRDTASSSSINMRQIANAYVPTKSPR